MAMLTTKDVCDQLSISRSSVGRLVTDGELPCYKLGKSLRYYQSDVDAYVERCRIAAAPAAVCAPQPRPKPQPADQKRGAGVLPRHEGGVSMMMGQKKGRARGDGHDPRCKSVVATTLTSYCKRNFFARGDF